MLDYVVKELSACTELHDQIELLLGFNYLIQLYHVGVLNYFEDMYLP